MAFVEVKAPKRLPTEAQAREILRLRTMGFAAFTVSSKEQVWDFIEWVKTRIEEEKMPDDLKRESVYSAFFSLVSCLFVEGVEFMSKLEIYHAIKQDWEESIMKLQKLAEEKNGGTRQRD